MSNCTRVVSLKIQQEVYCACVSLADQLGVCRASTQLLCNTAHRCRASVEAALTYLELAGRIDRTTYFIRPGVSYRDIRTFPRYYNVGRQLQYCANKDQYRYLRGAAEHREMTFKEIAAERIEELWPDVGIPS